MHLDAAPPDFNLPRRCPSLAPSFVRALGPLDERSVALFDADGTLYRGDAADDFTQWLIAEGRAAPGASWEEYTRIYRRDPAAGCRYLLRFYTGLPFDTLGELVWEFWRHHAGRVWIPEVLETMHLLFELGATLWIVTGSSTVSMLPLRDLLPVHDILGMDLELDEHGFVTGRLAGICCTGEGKAEKCCAALRDDQRVIFAAGNGPLDRAMMEISEGVVWSVYPDPSFTEISRAKGWQILARPADFIEETKLV